MDIKTRASGVLFFRLTAPVLGVVLWIYGISMGSETDACKSHWLKGFFFPFGRRSAIVVGTDEEVEEARAHRRARVTDSLSCGHWT